MNAEQRRIQALEAENKELRAALKVAETEYEELRAKYAGKIKSVRQAALRHLAKRWIQKAKENHGSKGGTNIT